MVEQETVSKNGSNKKVFSVLKNQPFQLTLRLKSATPAFNFSNSSLVAILVYDVESSKPVHFVRSSPLEYQTRVVDTDNNVSDTVTIDIRISALSSQHEDSFFKIKFTLKNLTVLSDAIRVVSKPAQLPSYKSAQGKTKKRTPNERINETLARIEQQQRDQQVLLGSLLQTITQSGIGNTSSAASSTTSSPINEPDSEPPRSTKRRRTESDGPFMQDDMGMDGDVKPGTGYSTSPADKFEQHLLGLIEASLNMAPSVRSELIRKLIRTSARETKEQLTEVIDCLWMEGLQHHDAAVNVETGSPYEPNLLLPDCSNGIMQ